MIREGLERGFKETLESLESETKQIKAIGDVATPHLARSRSTGKWD